MPLTVIHVPPVGPFAGNVLATELPLNRTSSTYSYSNEVFQPLCVE